MPAFAGQPDWYSGDVSALRNAATRANQVTTAPFAPYPNNRLRNAPFSPLQTLAFNQGQAESQNPEYGNIFGQSTGAIRNALGQNISPTLAPYLAGATANPTINAQQYMNPYNEAVTNNIGRLASRNLTENILPHVNDQFIRSGSYGSSGRPGSRSHEDITGRSIRDTQEAVTREQANALQKGYTEALGTSVGQQGAQLGAGRVAGNALGLDLERQISGGTALQGLSGQQQGERRQGIGMLSNLGTQQQQQEQAGLNTAFQDFQAEQNFPYLQAARENELLRGLPVSQFTASTNPYIPPLPQPSPWTQGAGLLAGIAGMQGQRQGYAEGGTVKKKHVSVSHLRHYADGGEVDMSPIQKGVNDAMDTSEIQAMRRHAQKLSQERINPMWAGISRAGFNLAANPRLGILGKLGEAGNAALDEYHAQLGGQDNRDVQASNIYNLIDNTRRLQAERNRNHELALKQFEETSRHHKVSEGLQSAKEAREEQEYEKTKGLIEGPGKMLYNLETNEEGKQIAKPLEGMNFTPSKSAKQINEEKKTNEDALQEWSSTLSTAKEERKLIDLIDEANEKLGTTGFESLLSEYKLTEPFANYKKASRAGKATIDQMRSLTEAIAALRIGKLKGKGNTVAHQQTIKATKQNEKYTKKANQDISKRDREKLDYNEGEAEFGTKMFNKYKDPSTGNPIFSATQIKKAYKNWKDNKGDKNLQTPEDYLEAMVNEEKYGVAKENEESQLSDEQKHLRSSLGLGG